MSFCIRCQLFVENRGGLFYKYSQRETPYISELCEEKHGISIYQGEFRSTVDELASMSWEKKPDELLRLDAPFTAVKVDKEDNKIWFASSKYGVTQLFYYHDNATLIVSDDFWEIVNCLDITFDDIDQDAIRETFAVGSSLFTGTFVKNLYEVNSGMFYTFDIQRGQLKEEKYFDFRMKERESTLDQATEELDEILTKALDRIYKEMGDVSYSMGLSGGLDSRLIPHYAKKNGMKLTSYILGEPRPRGLLLSRDHRNSRKLAEIFHLKHTECKWNLETFKDTMEYDIRNSPMCVQQFFKGRSDIDFDVLLTGGSGYWVGCSCPANLQIIDKKKLGAEIRRLFSAVSPFGENLRFVNAVLRILFGKEIKKETHYPWLDKILDKETDGRVTAKIEEYVSERKKDGKDNLSIFLEFYHFYGARNMFGGYESLSGRVRAFSIYTPHVVNAVMNWKYEYFEERRCLKNLIMKYVPETADVVEQKHEGKIGTKPSFFKKLFYGFQFWLYGNGNDIVYYKFKYVEDMFYQCLTNDCKWFYQVFPIRDDFDEIVKFKGKGFLASVWKNKIILDYLETGEYKKFIDVAEMKAL